MEILEIYKECKNSYLIDARYQFYRNLLHLNNLKLIITRIEKNNGSNYLWNRILELTRFCWFIELGKGNFWGLGLEKRILINLLNRCFDRNFYVFMGHREFTMLSLCYRIFICNLCNLGYDQGDILILIFYSLF